MTDMGNSTCSEESICMRCGFCCDGTLFVWIQISPAESNRMKITPRKTSVLAEQLFLPCRFFSAICTIYDLRPASCSGYRCQLLEDYSSGRITYKEACGIISSAREMRAEVMNMYRSDQGKKFDSGFRQLLIDIRHLQREKPDGEINDKFAGIFQAKCNIFETLLIKHFVSKARLEKLIMK